jgi:hypothetical protein
VAPAAPVPAPAGPGVDMSPAPAAPAAPAAAPPSPPAPRT